MFENTYEFIVKVTKSCNLRCKYCYVKDKDSNENIFMTFDTFKRLVDKIIYDKKKINNLGSPVEIVFHGGEPTLLGYESYKKFLSYAYRQFKSAGIPLKFAMQTNATLLNEDHKNLIRLFKYYKVDLGYSFDGLDNSLISRGISKKRWKEFFEFLERNRLTKSFLMVINRSNYKDFFKNLKFLKKHNINNIKANYVVDVNNLGGLEITGEEFFIFIIKPYLDLLIRSPKKVYVREHNIMEVLKKYFEIYIRRDFSRGNLQGICYIKFCGANSKIVEINPDGSVDRCGRYSLRSEYSAAAKTFWEEDFFSLNFIENLIDFTREKHKAIIERGCDACEASNICDYGCMAFEKEKTGKWGIPEEVCKLFKLTIDYIIDNEFSLFKSWIIYLKGNKEKYFLDLGRIAPMGSITLQYPDLINLITKAGLKWEPDLDYEYEGSKGLYSKYIVIKE